MVLPQSSPSIRVPGRDTSYTQLPLWKRPSVLLNTTSLVLYHFIRSRHRPVICPRPLAKRYSPKPSWQFRHIRNLHRPGDRFEPRCKTKTHTPAIWAKNSQTTENRNRTIQTPSNQFDVWGIRQDLFSVRRLSFRRIRPGILILQILCWNEWIEILIHTEQITKDDDWPQESSASALVAISLIDCHFLSANHCQNYM